MKEHTSFKVGGTVSHCMEIKTEKDLLAFADMRKKLFLPARIIGGGTNILFADTLSPMIVGVMKTKGVRIIGDDVDNTIIAVSAGEVWDDVVAFSVVQNLSGAELLSAIPGTAGATPIQNVGAYGREVKDILVSVKTFNLEDTTYRIWTNDECQFGYRTSIFKQKDMQKYVITEITLILKKVIPEFPKYKDVKKYFEERKIQNPSSKEIREAIIAIRKNKLPDPSVIPNVGSFFKNPHINRHEGERLKTEYSDIPLYEAPGDLFKVSAGWLIERAGFKGMDIGSVGVYEKNALVLYNKRNASFLDVMVAQKVVAEKVKSMFGIEIEMEPVIVE